MENIVNDILAIAPAKQYEIRGNSYTDKKLYRLPPVTEREKSPEQVSGLSTLSGLISMLRVETDEIIKKHGDIFLLVKSASEVQAFTTFRREDIPLTADEILPYGKRQVLYTTKYSTPQIKLNAFLPYETAIIQLNALFEKTEERDELIKAISSIDRNESGGIEDNGVSQTVTAKSGIALKNKTTIKPIWRLKPYRSFVEASLAEVALLLRVNDKFEVGLYECDGGKWELDAKDNIRWYLENKIHDFAQEVSTHIHVIS